MSDTPLEHDLLDLIEGRLAPDRVDAVRAALARDPALLKRVERMVADRRGIIELGRATEQAGRADQETATEIVRSAMARAEREALVAGSGAGSSRKFLALAAAVAVVITASMIAVGVSWLGVQRSERERLADEHKFERTGKGLMSEGTSLEQSHEGAPSAAEPVASLPPWITPTKGDPLAADAVQSWAGEVERKLTDEPADASGLARAPGAAKQIKLAAGTRLTPEEAASLALSHRLKLVVRGAAPDSRAPAAADSGPMAGNAGMASQEAAQSPASPPRDRYHEVRSALDADRRALRDALNDLRRRYAPLSPDDAWFEVDSSDPNGAIPSVRLGDILWWVNAPAAWQPGVSVRVRVDQAGSASPAR